MRRGLSAVQIESSVMQGKWRGEFENHGFVFLDVTEQDSLSKERTISKYQMRSVVDRHQTSSSSPCLSICDIHLLCIVMQSILCIVRIILNIKRYSSFPVPATDHNARDNSPVGHSPPACGPGPHDCPVSMLPAMDGCRGCPGSITPARIVPEVVVEARAIATT